MVEFKVCPGCGGKRMGVGYSCLDCGIPDEIKEPVKKPAKKKKKSSKAKS